MGAVQCVELSSRGDANAFVWTWACWGRLVVEESERRPVRASKGVRGRDECEGGGVCSVVTGFKKE